VTKPCSVAIASALVLIGLPPRSAGAAGPQLGAWVSATGVDNSSCGAEASPCRTFQWAHGNIVKVGGTIYVRDPANYGPLVISNAISIINDGVGSATIWAPSGDAIDVRAPSGVVLIKGLILDGIGTGTNGINFSAGSNLTIANCTIKGFTGTGILVAPNSSAQHVNFSISDTIVSGNGKDGIGIDGLYFAGTYLSGTITRVEASGNGGSGVNFSSGNLFATAQNVIATDVNASNNGVGFTIAFAGYLALHRTVVTGNGTGVNSVDGNVPAFFQDNLIVGNTTNLGNFGITVNPAANGLY
jgi:hypothetical protein